MSKRVLIYICILTLASACKPSKKRQLEIAAGEVMIVHDRTMSKHDELFKLKKNLVSISMVQTDSMIIREISNSVVDLEKADKDMMNWMHNYTSPEDRMPFDEQMAYYKEEKKKIEDIEAFTTKVKDRARGLIDRYSIGN